MRIRTRTRARRTEQIATRCQLGFAHATNGSHKHTKLRCSHPLDWQAYLCSGHSLTIQQERWHRPVRFGLKGELEVAHRRVSLAVDDCHAVHAIQRLGDHERGIPTSVGHGSTTTVCQTAQNWKSTRRSQAIDFENTRKSQRVRQRKRKPQQIRPTNTTEKTATQRNTS